MGCANSNVAPPVNPTMLNIPPVPDWDGQIFPVISVPVQFQITGGLMSVSCSIQPIFDAILSPQTGGSGYRLTTVFLPVVQSGDEKGRPLDATASGFMSMTARAMLLFQADPHEAANPIETLFLQSPLTITAGFASQQASGYENIYGQLQNAGQQGFPLSVVIDQPDVRCNGFMSSQTQVNLVCQRRQGTTPEPKEYNVVNCPMQMQMSIGSQSAQIPTLMSTLQMYMNQGYKVASIYNPPCIQGKAFSTSAQTACHIIFEKTSMRYTALVHDVPFQVSFGFGSATVNHQQYLGVIQRYVQEGWELAAMIDMPDGSMMGLGQICSTLKLVFQAALRSGAGPSSAGSDSVEIEVAVPEGMGPGGVVEVKHPNTGQAFQCTIPQGVSAGETFKMRLG